MYKTGKIQMMADDYEHLATIYKPKMDAPQSVPQLKSFLQSKLVRQSADDQLLRTLHANSIDMDFLIRERLDLLKLSKDSKQYKVALMVIEGFEDFLNMHSNKTITNTQTLQSVSVDELNQTIIEATQSDTEQADTPNDVCSSISDKPEVIKPKVIINDID